MTFEGGRKAFLVQTLPLHVGGMIGQGQGIDGQGILQGENRKLMIVDGGAVMAKL